MIRPLALVLGAALILGTGARAQEMAAERGPVVVELYTSQGCSSCPAADAFLADLADREDIVALALHVDYWDYIGWPDTFADPAHTARQKAYAMLKGTRSIYTPQMIVDGVHHLAGARAMQVAQSIFGEREVAQPVSVTLTRDGDRVRLEAVASGAIPPAEVYLVRYLPSATVAIERGENAGRTIEYRNIVTAWDRIAEWDGTAPLRLTREAAGPEPVVAIVQAVGPGAILGAARVE